MVHRGTEQTEPSSGLFANSLVSKEYYWRLNTAGKALDDVKPLQSTNCKCGRSFTSSCGPAARACVRVRSRQKCWKDSRVLQSRIPRPTGMDRVTRPDMPHGRHFIHQNYPRAETLFIWRRSGFPSSSSFSFFFPDFIFRSACTDTAVRLAKKIKK